MKKLKIFEAEENNKYDNFVMLLAPGDSNNFIQWYKQNISSDKSDKELEKKYDIMMEGTSLGTLFKKYAMGGKKSLKGVKADKDRGFTTYYVDPQEAKDNGWSVDTSQIYGDTY